MKEENGLRLWAIRRQRQLTLREVEERSFRFAQARGNPSYRVSASWLYRLERQGHELTVNKLMTLAEIYKLPIEELFRSMYPAGIPDPLRQLSIPNRTMLLTEGPLERQARYLLPDTLGTKPVPDETTLLSVENGVIPMHHKRGIIGKRDNTLRPMISAGSIIQIDTQQRTIVESKHWPSEFERPIYFLMTGSAYACGWCELERGSEWLTLIPHPLSPDSTRRWKFRKEIELIGRVILVAVRLTS